MATTKRLTPTGVNMSIPEFTDRPDQRVNSTALGLLADAINTLLSSDVFALKTGTDIPRNTDFNTLITPGSYRVRSYSDSATMTNIPIARAGTLYVKNGMLESGANYIQHIYATFDNNIYIRYSENKGSTWNAWDQLVLKSEFASLTVRSIGVPYTIAANGQWNTNLYTIINEDLPSGYEVLGIVGLTTNDVSVYPVSFQYYNGNYSFQIKNITSTSITGNATVRYLCVKRN